MCDCQAEATSRCCSAYAAIQRGAGSDPAAVGSSQGARAGQLVSGLALDQGQCLIGGSDNRGLGDREPIPLPGGNNEDGDGKDGEKDEMGEDGEVGYVGDSDKVLLVQKSSLST